VKEDWRKKGLGKQIMFHLMDEAKKQKCYKICLVCSKENEPFYVSCHFEERGVQMSYLLDSK